MEASEMSDPKPTNKYELPVMERTKKEIGDLTADEIASESYKMFWSNTTLQWLLLGLNLPNVIYFSCVFLLCLNFLRYAYYREFEGLPPAETTFMFTLKGYLWANPALTLLVVIGFWPSQAIGVLSYCVNVHAVGLISKDKTVSFRSLLKGATGSWPRVVVSFLCYKFVVISRFMVPLACLNVATVMIFDFPITSIFISFIMLVFNFSMGFMTDFLDSFKVAFAVCILEELTGRAALRRAMQLLEEKRGVASVTNSQYSFGLHSGLAILVLFSLFCYNELEHPNDPWNPVGRCLLVVSMIVVGTYVVQINSISAGVAFISFKAYYEKKGNTSLEGDEKDEI